MAFVATEWDPVNNTITSYFKRGQLPNEAYGPPSVISINLEALSNVNSTFDAQITLERKILKKKLCGI